MSTPCRVQAVVLLAWRRWPEGSSTTRVAGRKEAAAGWVVAALAGTCGGGREIVASGTARRYVSRNKKKNKKNWKMLMWASI